MLGIRGGQRKSIDATLLTIFAEGFDMMFARFRAVRARDKKLKAKAFADAYEKGYAEGYAKGKAENGDNGNESPKSPKKPSK